MKTDKYKSEINITKNTKIVITEDDVIGGYNMVIPMDVFKILEYDSIEDGDYDDVDDFQNLDSYSMGFDVECLVFAVMDITRIADALMIINENTGNAKYDQMIKL